MYNIEIPLQSEGLEVTDKVNQRILNYNNDFSTKKERVKL